MPVCYIIPILTITRKKVVSLLFYCKNKTKKCFIIFLPSYYKKLFSRLLKTSTYSLCLCPACLLYNQKSAANKKYFDLPKTLTYIIGQPAPNHYNIRRRLHIRVINYLNQFLNLHISYVPYEMCKFRFTLILF